MVGASGQSGPASNGTVIQQSTSAPNNYVAGDALRSAIGKFKARLSGPQLIEFQGTTHSQLCQEIIRIQNDQEKNKNMMHLSRIQGCLEALDQLGKVVEVFLNISNLVAFVWGPMKFLLLAASNFTDSFEILLDAYERIGQQLPLLQEYEALFSQNQHMVEALVQIYIDILDFHQHAIRFFQGTVWKKLFKSIWKDFGTKYNGILKSLARSKDLIECRANLSQYRRYQEDMSTLKSGIEELIEQEHLRKRKEVKEWLAVGSLPEIDHEKFSRRRNEYPTTGQWIHKHDHIKDWMCTDVPNSPIVWMKGIPGAGKTILASNIIDECRKRAGFVTTHFYCDYSNERANTAIGVIRGLLDQMVDNHPQLLPHCYSRYAANPTFQYFSSAEKLLEDCCVTIPKQFIIVDGLDECEPGERKRLLTTLVNIIGQCDDDEAGKLRVLFVSQEYSDIKNALHSSSKARVVPKIISLSSADNKGDIQTYVKVQVKHIANKFKITDKQTCEYLRDITIDRANGMFLYARLVMENLFNQPRVEDFIEAILENNLPKDLESAYGRIITRIKKTSHQNEWSLAKKLLGWMVCCKRQLTWKEIQVAISIDPEDQTIYYEDRRLIKHIHDICGSLVTVSYDRVTLVHSTAKCYITKCTKDIDESLVECQLATLCLQYLTFPCFQIDENPDVAKRDLPKYREMMLKGEFAFQDYAVATWFMHVNAFVKTGKDLVARGSPHLEDISKAIDDFLDRYDDENFHDNRIKACETECEAFREEDFYDDIIALTSYIYMFQTKGFEARVKISIKSLKAALERNRRLLEGSVPTLKPDELEKYKEFYDAERRFKCNKINCRYFSGGFKDKKSAKRHTNYHDRPHKCEIDDCLGNEGFANLRDLEKHNRAFHPEMSDLAERFNSTLEKKGKATHVCAHCGKSFTRKQIMKDHMLSHLGERPHECAECGRAFTRKNDLTRHKKLHDRPRQA